MSFSPETQAKIDKAFADRDEAAVKSQADADAQAGVVKVTADAAKAVADAQSIEDTAKVESANAHSKAAASKQDALDAITKEFDGVFTQGA